MAASISTDPTTITERNRQQHWSHAYHLVTVLRYSQLHRAHKNCVYPTLVKHIQAALAQR